MSTMYEFPIPESQKFMDKKLCIFKKSTLNISLRQSQLSSGSLGQSNKIDCIHGLKSQSECCNCSGGCLICDTFHDAYEILRTNNRSSNCNICGKMKLYARDIDDRNSIADYAKKINQLTQEAKKVKEAIKKKDEEISNLEDKISEKCEEIDKLNEIIMKQEDEVKSLKAEVDSERNNKISRTSKEKSYMKAEVNHKDLNTSSNENFGSTSMQESKSKLDAHLEYINEIQQVIKNKKITATDNNCKKDDDFMDLDLPEIKNKDTKNEDGENTVNNFSSEPELSKTLQVKNNRAKYAEHSKFLDEMINDKKSEIIKVETPLNDKKDPLADHKMFLNDFLSNKASESIKVEVPSKDKANKFNEHAKFLEQFSNPSNSQAFAVETKKFEKSVVQDKSIHPSDYFGGKVNNDYSNVSSKVEMQDSRSSKTVQDLNINDIPQVQSTITKAGKKKVIKMMNQVYISLAFYARLHWLSFIQNI